MGICVITPSNLAIRAGHCPILILFHFARQYTSQWGSLCRLFAINCRIGPLVFFHRPRSKIPMYQQSAPCNIERKGHSRYYIFVDIESDWMSSLGNNKEMIWGRNMCPVHSVKYASFSAIPGRYGVFEMANFYYKSSFIMVAAGSCSGKLLGFVHAVRKT